MSTSVKGKKKAAAKPKAPSATEKEPEQPKEETANTRPKRVIKKRAPEPELDEAAARRKGTNYEAFLGMLGTDDVLGGMLGGGRGSKKARGDLDDLAERLEAEAEAKKVARKARQKAKNKK
jgi:hypothetical protein